jgi:hypothetical protein
MNARTCVTAVAMVVTLMGTACTRRTTDGTVADAAGIPVPGLSIELANTDHRTSTGADGTFSLPFAEGEAAVRIVGGEIAGWCAPAPIATATLTKKDYPEGWVIGTVRLECYVERHDDGTRRFVSLDRRWVDEGDGTVLDTLTGVVWQQDGNPPVMKWEQAVAYCEDLALAGMNDWRLPGKDELAEIVQRQYRPMAHPAMMARPGYYWSSTENHPFHPESAWNVDFIRGRVYFYNKQLNYLVRCARGERIPR